MLERCPETNLGGLKQPIMNTRQQETNKQKEEQYTTPDRITTPYQWTTLNNTISNRMGINIVLPPYLCMLITYMDNTSYGSQ